MTNPIQPIPPCPVCGVVPPRTPSTLFYAPICCEHTGLKYTPHQWDQHCRYHLGRALSDKYGIHTLADLESRLAPDPRVAVDLGSGYFDGGMALIEGDCPKCGMSSMHDGYFDPKQHRCAAQRGEGV